MKIACINVDGRDGGLGTFMKQEILKNFILENDIDVIGVLEAEIANTNRVPKILDCFFNHYAPNPKRMVVYYHKKLSLTPKTVDCGMPNIQLIGDNISITFLYSEFTTYFEDGSQVGNNPMQRLKILQNAMRKLENEKPSQCYLGDFNYNLNKYTKGLPKMYYDFMCSLNLEQVINEPTHPKTGLMLEATMIDHIWVRNFPGNAFVKPYSSDHEAICIFTSKIKKKERILKTVKKEVFGDFTKNFAIENKPKILKKGLTEENRTEFISSFNEWLRKMIEKSQVEVNYYENSQPWYNKYLQSLSEELGSMHKKDPMYKRKRNFYNRQCKKAIYLQERKKITKRGHEFEPKPKKPLKELFREDKTLTSDEQEMANILVKGFDDKVQNVLKSVTLDYEPLLEKVREKYTGLPEWELPIPTKREVDEMLSSLKKKASRGFDNISFQAALSIQEEILEPLTEILQEMFKKAWFDPELFNSLITAIYKNKGDIRDKQFTRPVSCGAFVMRCFEKLLNHYLLKIFEELKVFPDSLRGFVPGHSVTTASEGVLERIEQNRLQSYQTVVLGCDLKCAFDSLSRELAIKMFEIVKMSPKSLEVMRGYLFGDWKMRVRVGNVQSYPINTKVGIIQGSSVSSTIFALATLVLFYNLEHIGTSIYYADDSIYLLKVPKEADADETEEIINNATTTITDTMSRAGFVPEPTKTTLVALKSASELMKSKYYVKGTEVKPQNTFVFVGMTFSQNIGKFLDHKTEIINRIKSRKWQVIEMSTGRSNQQKARIFDALIMSSVSYSGRIWLPTLKAEELEEIQKEVNIAFNHVMNNYGMKKQGHFKLFGLYGIKTVKQIRDYFIVSKIPEFFSKFKEELKKSRTRSGNAGMLSYGIKDGLEFYRRLFNHFGGQKMLEKKDPKTSFKNYIKLLIKKQMQLAAKMGRLANPPPELTLIPKNIRSFSIKGVGI